jgi:phosphoribosylformylglycinamidine synthase subunit PurQ / glutaminase
MKRVMVLRGFGFNCEEETSAAYRLLGHTPEVVHVQRWLAGEISLQDFDVLHVPGGFSFGDALGSGQVFANRLRHGAAWPDVKAFLVRRGRILGVCNGFQVLVRTGLLPNLSGNFTPEVSLAPNASTTANANGGFINQWVRTRGADAGASFEFPIRHGEGRLVFGSEDIEARARSLIALRYVDVKGNATAEANPNGSAHNAAALRSADGLVLGIMPHPEAYVLPHNHPAWGLRARSDAAFLSREADGLRFMGAFIEGTEI